jgi:hypothetical protein
MKTLRFLLTNWRAARISEVRPFALATPSEAFGIVGLSVGGISKIDGGTGVPTGLWLDRQRGVVAGGLPDSARSGLRDLFAMSAHRGARQAQRTMNDRLHQEEEHHSRQRRQGAKAYQCSNGAKDG